MVSSVGAGCADSRRQDVREASPGQGCCACCHTVASFSLGCATVTVPVTDLVASPVTRPPVVLIAEELAPSVLKVLGDEVEIRHVDGADRAALLPALADAAAVLVRSATRIDAEALAAAPNLQVVARAGVG